MSIPKIRVDISGQRFGRLTAGDVVGATAGRQTLWRCACDCGAETVVGLSQLRSGMTRSCGCLGREAHSWPRGHGVPNNDPIYRLWCNIKTRCFNQRRACWRNYGGRGITMHPAWRDDFARFRDDLLAELGPRPEGTTPRGTPVYTLDRIDNDGHYEPGNLRWATASEQGRNRRPWDRSRSRRRSEVSPC